MTKSVWISIAVALAAFTALTLAPRYTDQARLRAILAPALQHALRQGVAIEGPIHIALLPEPTIKAEQVRVLRDGKILAEIPAVEAGLQLLPLLTGKIETASLRLIRPVIRIETADKPASQPAALPPPAPAPALNQPAPARNFAFPALQRIAIEGGSLTLSGLGGRVVALSPIDLIYRAQETAVSLAGKAGYGGGEVAVDVEFSRAGDHITASRVTLRRDGLGEASWEGNGDPLADAPAQGKLRLALKDYGELTADLVAGRGDVHTDNLHLALGDSDWNGRAGWSRALGRAEITLHGGILDLDHLLPKSAAPAEATPPPAAAPPPPQTGDAPSAPGTLLLPPDLILAVRLSADQILWRGIIFQDGRIEMDGRQGGVTLGLAKLTLPGNSIVSLSGRITPSLALDGQIEARCDDLRQLLDWAGIATGRVPGDRLRAFRLKGRLAANPAEITLDQVEGTLDSSHLEGGGRYAFGPHPSLSLRLAVDQVNGDAYWSKAEPTPPATEPAASSEQATAPPEAKKGEIDLGLEARIGRFSWQGVGLQDVVLSASLSGGDLAVKSLSATDPSGGKLGFSGHVTGDSFQAAHATLKTPDLGRSLRPFGIDLPLSGPADLGADISGPLAMPTMAITAPALEIGRALLASPSATVSVGRDGVALERLTAGLYGGSLTGSGATTQGGGALSLHLVLARAQMRQALLEIADIALAEGELGGELTLSTYGRNPAERHAHLAGQANLAVRDGEIKGFDLKSADQKLAQTGGVAGLIALIQAGLTGGATRFSSLAGTAQIDHGVITSKDLKLVAEGGGATGEAVVDLPADHVAAHADFHFASAKDAPPLTLRLEGSLENPRRFLDVKPLQQWLAEHGVKTGKPKDVLKGLLQGLTR